MPTKEIQKTARELRIIDDALFRLVAADQGVCQEIIQTLLGNNSIRVLKSSVTANATPKGMSFKDVPNVTVIYITEYDALGNGQVFTISEMCAKTEAGYVPMNDGAKICYANTAIKDDSDKSELMQLFLEKDSFDNERFPELSSRMQYFKDTEKGRKEVCTLVENYAKDYAEEVARKIARKMLCKGDNPVDIAECTELSLEEVLEIKESENLQR